MKHKIDYLGAALLALAATAIVLLATWGRQSVRMRLTGAAGPPNS